MVTVGWAMRWVISSVDALKLPVLPRTVAASLVGASDHMADASSLRLFLGVPVTLKTVAKVVLKGVRDSLLDVLVGFVLAGRKPPDCYSSMSNGQPSSR